MTRRDIPSPVSPNWAAIDSALRDLDADLLRLQILPPKLRVPKDDAEACSIVKVEKKLREMGLGIQADQAREIHRAAGTMLGGA